MTEPNTPDRELKAALEELNNCKDYMIHIVFKAMPPEVKMNEAIVKMALEKCPECFLSQLLEAVPDEVKTNDAVFKTILVRCYGSDIPQLFEVLPADVQTKGDDVKVALEACKPVCIPALFQVVPIQWKMNEAVVKMALEKCYGDDIPDLFGAMPDEVKANDDVVKMSIKRCAGGEMPELFEAMPDQVEPNALKDYVLHAVDCMDALNPTALKHFHDFLSRLPANLSDDPDILSAFKRKEVMKLPFLQKYQKLLWAAVKVSIIYLLVLGPIEGAIWFKRNAPGTIKDLSNQHWKNKTDLEEVHFEIFDGCVLSAAPQPFDFALPLTALKLLVITAAFGFISRNLMAERDNPEKKWKVWVGVIMIVYSVIMIPLSFISLVVHYVFEVSPQIHGGSFKKYECLYAIVNLAPFQTNYLMYLTQFLASLKVSYSAGLDMRRVTDRIQEHIQAFLSRKLPTVAKETLVQPLLDDGITIGEMQAFKVTGKFILFSLTLAPYLYVETPFIITHKIPAAACFFPFVILIISVSGLIFAIVNRDFLRKFREQEGEQAKWDCFVDWLKTVEEAGYMPIVPALWGLLVINEFLTLAPIYWYGGAGWFDSAMMVLVERSLYIYVKVFWIRIMTKFWSGVSLVNEIT